MISDIWKNGKIKNCSKPPARYTSNISNICRLCRDTWKFRYDSICFVLLNDIECTLKGEQQNFWHSQLWPHQLPTQCQPWPTGSAFRKDLKSISRGVRSVQSFLQWWSWITTILPYLCSAGTPRVIPADHPKKGTKGVPKPSSVGKHG